MSETIITKDNFENEVLKSEKPVLLDFWATWCGPCRMLSLVVSQIAERYGQFVKVGKVNVDEQPQLAGSFGVSSIPMVVIIKDGKAVNGFVGYKPFDQVEALVKQYI